MDHIWVHAWVLCIGSVFRNVQKHQIKKNNISQLGVCNLYNGNVEHSSACRGSNCVQLMATELFRKILFHKEIND